MILSNDVIPADTLRHGAYLCLTLSAHDGRTRAASAGAAIAALATHLGFQQEFEAADGPPAEAIAFLRRVEATPADLDDDGVLRADAVIHVASTQAAPVAAFRDEAVRLLRGSAHCRVFAGVVRPPAYTGGAMHAFAYAAQVRQQAGHVMPHAFLLPMRKTADWWAKDWMQRHTYFLPRYDEQGHMTHEGHALAAAPGIATLMRRTYKHVDVPAPDDDYDFVNYFECADEGVPTFHAVLAALRDQSRNPEWRFVREGPMWQGRRVATWTELFDTTPA